MTRLLLLSPLLLLGTPVRADDPTVSPRQAVVEKLPTYSNEAHDRAVAAEAARTAAREAAKAAAAADPNLVVLPDMTVMEKQLQRMEEDSLYQKGAFDKELVKRELSSFDRNFLNRYTVPLFGVSKEARARAAYLVRRNAEVQERMARLNRLVALVDPVEARDFHNVLRDASLDNANTTKEIERSTSAKGGAGGRDSQ